MSVNFILDLDRAKMALKSGADVNEKGENGRTPLHKSHNDEITRLLILNGADVNAQDNIGMTPLHNAPNAKIAQLLVSSGADLSIKNDSGETPLEYIRQKQSLNISKEFSSDVNAVVNILKNPNAGLITLLEEASKKISELTSSLEFETDQVKMLKNKIMELELQVSINCGMIQKTKEPVKEPKIWACKNPYKKLSTDIQERLGSCTVSTKGDEKDGDVVYTDQISCMRQCTK